MEATGPAKATGRKKGDYAMNKKIIGRLGICLAVFGYVWLQMFLIDEALKSGIVWMPGDTILLVGGLALLIGAILYVQANW